MTVVITAGTKRELDTRPDVGDIRDYIYRPTLSRLSGAIDCRTEAWWSHDRVRDQGSKPSCTGHALASIVDRLRERDRWNAETPDPGSQPVDEPWASARMLYATAQYHDAWPGEDYRGSSIRGALQGFYYNGVCSCDVGGDNEWDEEEVYGAPDWHMNREILASARSIQIGAYYRVRARLADVHAAIGEVGLVLVSADVHEGWWKYTDSNSIAFEPARSEKSGRHAFVIIGYDRDGFIIQNSWGKGWKDNGYAHWSYDDWATNIIDQWVLRLAAPIDEDHEGVARPQVANNRTGMLRRSQFEDVDDGSIPAPSRLDVIGHVVPLARGTLDSHGHYNANKKTLLETAHIVRGDLGDDGQPEYRHLLLHFLDLQPQQRAAVTALRDALPVFKQNGIYPIFVMLENEISAEIHRMCARTVQHANEMVGLQGSEEKDRLIEGRLSLVAKRLLDEIENSAAQTMQVVGCEATGTGIGEGAELLKEVFRLQDQRHRVDGTLSYHISAHGFGAAIVKEILKSAKFFDTFPTISTINLIAPMLRMADFTDHFEPYLEHPAETPVRRSVKRESISIERVRLLALSEAAHSNDPYIPGYGASWPELWSRIGKLQPRNAAEKDGPRFLALPGNAQALVDPLSRDKKIDLEILSPSNNHTEKPRHLGLDMQLPILDDILRTVLENDPCTPTFEEYYRGRKSLSYVSQLDGLLFDMN